MPMTQSYLEPHVAYYHTKKEVDLNGIYLPVFREIKVEDPAIVCVPYRFSGIPGVMNLDV